MNTSENQIIFHQSNQPHMESVSVGDYSANPERQVIEWVGIYFQGKYYLADPNAISKLQQIQAEIELQKKVATSYNQSERDQAESARSFDNKLDQSDYSIATELSPQKLKLKQIKADKQLQKQEEIYIKTLIQAKNKRNIQKKKGTKNLIQVKQKSQEFNSEKQHKIILQGNEQALNQSMINKITAPKQTPKVSPKEEMQLKQKIVQNNNQIRSEQIDLFNIIDVPNDKQAKQQDQHFQHLVKDKEKDNDKSILPLQSDQQKIDNVELAKQRAGNSFFNQINSQIYQLQINLESINQPNVPAKNIFQSIFSEKGSEKNYVMLKENHPMLQTKNILQQLNQHFVVIQYQQEGKQQISEIKKQQLEPGENTDFMQLLEKDNKNSQNMKKSVPKQLEIEQNCKKKKHLTVMPSIINYQISQTSIKNQDHHHVQEKQRLQKQISLLHQVVGELRVERLKHQISQNSRYGSKMDEQSAAYSGYQQTERIMHERRFSDLPQNTKTNLNTGTIMSNFEQSVVSEFYSASRSHLVRTKSGKIVKNMSPEKKMPKIDQEQNVQTKTREMVESKQKIELRQQDKDNGEDDKQDVPQSKKLEVVQQVETFLQFHEENRLSNDLNYNTIEVNKQQEQIKSKQHQFKIKINHKDNSKIFHVSQAKRKGSFLIHEDNLPNQTQRSEQDMQSSMPRALISKYNSSRPPKITIQQHNNHKKIHEHTTQINLMKNFQTFQKSAVKQQTPQSQHIDPKRRAFRQGNFKHFESKGSCNPEIEKLKNNKTTNLKQRIYQMEKNKPQNISSHQNNEQKSTINFRMRRESQGSRQSHASNKNISSKSCDNNKSKPKDNFVYVPAIDHESFNSTPQHKDNILYQVQLQPIEKQKEMSINVGFDVQKRIISFVNIQVPKFPSPPSAVITVQEMIEFIKEIGAILDIDFQDNQMKKLIMKKYKNCIMLDLPSPNSLKLVWHYNGKIYIGEWNENTLMKSGEGIQYIPGKYFYKGQFLDNKRSGTGNIILQNGARYEGQWLDGDKNGRGKYQDKSMGLYYQGQWRQGKRQGFGYLEVEAHSIYEGTFQSNYRCGSGVEKFVNGDSYKGQYQNGKFHGKGIYVWASRSSYQGSFVEGLKQGQGKWIYQMRQVYEGEYFADKKHGFGRYVWNNGVIYEGEFDNDRKNGKGLMKYPDGREIEGIWKEGQMVDILPFTDRQDPLEYKKAKKFETTTVIKVVQTKPNKFSLSGRLSQF